MKRRRKRKRGDVVMSPLKATAIREFTRPVMAGYCGDDLWRVMQHIQARTAFAHEPPENILVIFFRHIAIIVGKTYAERGEDVQLASQNSTLV